ncbi:MAG: ribosome assembly cofactor RimP [Treponema sp.]|jgi:ribosome maturation factor RimP|nr:ribosome assembly cofactor RimP [Treponema sp.]
MIVKKVVRRPFFIYNLWIRKGIKLRFIPRESDPLFDSLEEVVNGLGMSLVDLVVSRHKKSVQIHATIDKKGIVSVGDCSRVHRAIIPRLDLAFSNDYSVEVSSPGINRNIKNGAELVHYLGRGIRCYCSDVSDWVVGVLLAVDKEGIVIAKKDALVEPKKISYDVIAKAKLDYSHE